MSGTATSSLPRSVPVVFVTSESMLVKARLKVRRSRMRAATSSSTPFTSTSPSCTLANGWVGSGSGVSTFSCTIS